MTIEPDSDLFQAILAMDSYNRSYNSGIDLNKYDSNGNLLQASNATGVQIGTVTVLSDSTILGATTGRL